VIASIDPGVSGAIAWLADNGELCSVEDLPMNEVKVGKTMRKRLAGAALARMLIDNRPVHVFLEEVATRPGEGAVGAFSFGRGFGTIEGILAALAIPYTLVRPDVWKRGMQMPAKGDKGVSRTRAMQCFPSHATRFARVKDDGRAEAALIGSWGIGIMGRMA